MSCIMNNSTIGNCVIEQRMLGLEMTPLVLLFFGRTNVDFLHNAIISGVFEYQKKGTKIARQDEKALIQIMRGIFLEDARYSVTHISIQCDKLNDKVIRFCVPNIMRAFDEQEKNNKEVFSNPIPPPMSRIGIPTSTKAIGKNILEFKGFF